MKKELKNRTMARKAVGMYFLFSCLAVVILTAQCFSFVVYAQEHSEEEDRFDGSEFNAPTFKDHNLDKESYKDLRLAGESGGTANKENIFSREEGSPKRKKHEEKDIAAAGENDSNGSGKKKLEVLEKLPPISDLPSEWVPSGIDLTSNGGFSIAPNNGAPVPYRLNGHVEIQRGSP
jgi:hypothetical protein